MHSHKNFNILATVFGTLALACAPATFAANKYFSGSDSNDFTGTGNWTTSAGVGTTPPTTEDNVYITDASYGTNAPVFASGSLAIGAMNFGISGAGGQMEITGSAYLEAGSMNVGRSTGWGGRLILSENASMNTAGSSFQIGSENVGVVDMSGNSSIFTTVSVRIGVTGTFPASGTLSLRDNATFTTRSYMRVGGQSGTGGEGTLLLSGSSHLIVGYESATQYLTIGHTGTGTLIITDDATIEAPIVYIGREVSGHGTVHLQGGVIASAGIARGDGFAELDLNGGGVRAIADIGDFFGGFGELTINATGVAADKSAFTVDTGTNEVIMSSTFGYNGAEDTVAFRKIGAGTLILYAENTMNGVTHIAEGVLLSGTANILAHSRISIDSGAAFDMGGFDQTIKKLENRGAVRFGTDQDTVGRTLTIDGDMSGFGVIEMSVHLGNETGDKILVTGSATGDHELRLQNIGGSIDPEKKLTILTINKGGDALITANDVDGGMGTFFLVPEINASSGATEYKLAATGNNSIAADAIISTAASLGTEWHYSLDSLRNRFGEIRALPKPEKALTSTWYQASAYRLETQKELTTVPYEQNTYGGIFGVDRIIPRAESRVLFGAYVSINRSDRTYDTFGEGNTIDHNGGVYVTWLHDAGWFADFVIKGNQYKSSFAVTSIAKVHTTGDYNTWAGGFSAEFGRKFSFGHRFWIEPSVQMASAWFNGGDYDTSTGMHVEIDRSKATQYRGQVSLGFRGGKRWYPYAKAGIVRSDAGGGLVHVGKQSWETQYAGWRFEAGGGIAVTISDQSILYLGYEYNKADFYTRPWAVSLGYRRTW